MNESVNGGGGVIFPWIIKMSGSPISEGKIERRENLTSYKHYDKKYCLQNSTENCSI